MSDLHLEMKDNLEYLKTTRFEVGGDILVLAGDIIYLRDTIAVYNSFWDWAAKNYQQVLLVPGNHEFYGYDDVAKRGDSWQRKLRENISYHQNQVVRIDDTDFILSTLWSHIKEEDMFDVWRGMNDFHRVLYHGRLFTPDDFNWEHERSLHFLKKVVAESTAKHIVVVTHHLPTLAVVTSRHVGSVLNSAFATELGDFIADSRIDYWIYGHSHTNIDSMIGNTKIVSNQLGYVFSKEHLRNGFEPCKVVEI